MEDYVDKIGGLKPKHFKHKDAGDIKATVMKELGKQTTNITQMEEERRGDDPNPHLSEQGFFARENIFFIISVIKWFITGIVMPLLDMGSDIVTAVIHFQLTDPAWGILTLMFVWLPGFVVSVAIMVWGLRKEFSVRRLCNYLIFMLIFPILYPFVQIGVNAYMLYLMIRQRSREIVNIMGHDVRQFKSLEGFLESGPQFILQSYILLRGEANDMEDLTKIETRALVIILLTTLMSFISLTKTGFNVNVPDPDPDRSVPQYKESARFFWLTSILHHFVVTLFRVSCLAYFFACIEYYTIIVICFVIGVNAFLLHKNGASNTVSIILGTISVFMPNGYLLYNFAATFVVDFSYRGTRTYLFWHMVVATTAFLACLITFFVLGSQMGWEEWLVSDTIQYSESVILKPEVQILLDSILIGLGVLSLILCFIHWKVSIKKLFVAPEDQPGEEAESAEHFQVQEVGYDESET